MDVFDIISSSIKYPFSNIQNFAFVGVLSLLASLSSIVTYFGIDSDAVIILAGLFSVIFTVMLLGYAVSVIRIGIRESDEIPEIDLKNNLIEGIKAMIIGIIYFIIPIIIVCLLAILTGAIGASIDNLLASLGILAVIAMILFIIFAVIDMVALARFANSSDWKDALKIGEVIDDIKRIGVFNIIVFLIVAAVIIAVIGLVSTFLKLIPYAGIIISSFVVTAFLVLFYYRSLGMIYGSD